VGDGGDDELGDAHVVGDVDWFFAEVNECDEEFASVVCVDGARCVWDGEPVLSSEP